MASIRKPKEITNKEDLDYLLNIKEQDITTSFIMETFGTFNNKSRFQPFDTFTVPANMYNIGNGLNKKPFHTTVGIWVFNKYFIEPHLSKIFGYVNETINSKVLDRLNKTLSYALLEDDIELEALKDFIMKQQKCMNYVSILAPGHTLGLLLITKDIDKKKKELIKANQEAIDNNDPKVVDKITKELLDFARDKLKDDPSIDLYDSGARASFKNNFKNMYVMRGAIKDPDPNKGYNIIKSSYMDGIGKDEYSALANSLAAGPYARAKKTETGGYWEKLFLYACQHIKAGPKDSDCGTTRHIIVNVDEKNIDDIMYNYAIVGSRLVEINSKNRDQFIGKKIKLRYASMCKSKDYICNKCLGEMFYKLGIENIGTAMPQLASRLKVLQLKKFHDDQVSFSDMDLMKVFGLE